MGPKNWSGNLAEEIQLFPLPGIEPQTLRRRVSSLVTTLIELPCGNFITPQQLTTHFSTLLPPAHAAKVGQVAQSV